MANEGHILIKKSSGRWGTSQFFKDVDKGSAKPAFCYPRRAEGLREDLKKMEKTLSMGLVTPERKMAYEQKVKALKGRVDKIDESFDNARKIIETGKDGWKTRRDNLGERIASKLPTRKDVRDRRVNPHSVLRREKQGENGERPLQDDKRDFTIISRAMQAAGEYVEANHSFLQRDK